MADYAAVYTLTGTGSIVFNSGTLFNGSTTDLYWISVINGLDGPTIRAPIDDVPFGDGGLIHTFWKGPRHITVEGSLIVQSVDQNECQRVFNTLTTNLNTVLESILQTSGTLNWTPAGQDALSMPVFYEVPLNIQPTDNYRLRSFSFGLVSPDADP